MLLLLAAQMRALDREVIERRGIPGVVLMESAGRGVAAIIAARRRVRGARVGIVAGAGQNGGDGFVIARTLANWGAEVKVWLTAPRARVTGDAAVFLAAADKTAGVRIEDRSGEIDADGWSVTLAGCDVLVDAIFGTGLRADVTGVPAAAITAMNKTAAFRIAVDLPSGLDADTGAVRGVAVNADVTATIAAPKLGLWVDEKAAVGQIEVVDIGFAVDGLREIAAAHGPLHQLLTAEAIADCLPRQGAGGHKGTRGHALIVAGSAGKTGAAALCGQAALRAGAGLATVATTAAGQVALDAKVIEVMTAVYADGSDADATSAARLLALAARMKAVALGPGIPTGPGMGELVRHLARELPMPLVIDADGLNLLGSAAPALLARARGPRILTPHPGEMARLLDIEPAALASNRVGLARQYAAESRSIVVLKGARTVIADPGGDVFINPAADWSLGTAGSGDVLTGTITGLLAQSVSPIDAVRAAVFAHGLAGAEARRALGTSHLIAGDLPAAIARVLDDLQAATSRR